jgi:dienelactone hydrolase
VRRRRLGAFVALVALLGAALLAQPYLRAAGLLLRFSDPGSQARLARWGTHQVDIADATVAGPAGPIAARRYVPRGVSAAPGVVLLHGVHRLSIDEPRLVRFARAIAESGIVVLTPAITEIAGYRIDPASIDTIGASAAALAHERGRPVGVIGMSFAGGLALMTAADPRYAAAIGLVLSIGGHDDLMRVARFFAEDSAPEPDGPPLHLAAHPYGALVVAHANAEGFFPPEDQAAARRALVAWLGERWDEARAAAATLTAPSRELVQRLFDGKLHDAPGPFLAAIARLGAAMARVSPHGHLDGLRARVFLLHGAADPVIPASEARWLLRDLPAPTAPVLLVSTAIGHVELAGTPTLRDQLALVGFMTGMLRALDR